MHNEWIDAGFDETDCDLIKEVEILLGKSIPNPFTPQGFINLLSEIEKFDCTWSMAQMHENAIMTIYHDGKESNVINKCIYRAVFLCFLDVLVDSKNRQLL